jgi:uncharacterized membrane protein
MKALTLRLSLTALLFGSFGYAMADQNGRGEGRGHFDRPGTDRMAPDRFNQDRGATRNDDSRSGRDDTERRGSRLSPEERRALRQQINEAGQDLYQPKH